jgi:hypothetical protein
MRVFWSNRRFFELSLRYLATPDEWGVTIAKKFHLGAQRSL